MPPRGPQLRPGEPAEEMSAEAVGRVGRTLGGRWSLDALIGSGGSSFVYSAHHRNGRRVAVKVLRHVYAAEARPRQRFLSEGYAANSVRHPGVVSILDDGEEPDGTVFLVMEQLSGASLAKRLETQGPLSEAEVTRTSVAILDVLAAAHDQNILHRDIKPSNVFVTDEDHVKILDFGSARVRTRDDLTTASDTVLGTPAFMAPELAAGRTDDIDARTDIWAVGATMFQLLTGRTVHDERTKNAALVAAATRRARSIRSIRPETSPKLSEIIDRALSFEKSERWPNARAMAAALACIDGVHSVTSNSELTTVPEQPAPRVRRKERVKVAATAVLVGALFALIGLSWKPKAAQFGPVGDRAVPHVRAKPTAVVANAPAIPNASGGAPLPAVQVLDTSRDSLDHAVPPTKKAPTRRSVSSSPQASTSRAAEAPAQETVPEWRVDEILDRRK